jgi:type III secretion protein N (ATPase)
LLESIAEGSEADAITIALIGERGREAQAWIDRRNARTTVVCATSDRPPSERVLAAHVALAHASALRDRGLHVLLVLDSLARVAGALREVAIGKGESCGRGGYPPSVFSHLARIVEIAGVVGGGSMTLLASVLNDGEDRDPVSDAARSLLDGHVALSERLARARRFPSIDVCASVSRTMSQVASDAHRAAAARVRRSIARLDEVADARALGIEPGDRYTRAAVEAEARLEAFLRQAHRPVPPRESLAALTELADTLEEPHGYQ